MHELKVARSQALTTREMAQIGLFTALIAAGAYIKINIPVQPFPMHFTMQFLFVLLAGFLLGARRGAICVGIYLAVGLSGIPVFAAGGGPAYLIRPTFGFLLGFVFAAWITGKLSSLRPGAGTAWDLFSAFWGMMAYYVSGMVYFYGISNYVIHMPIFMETGGDQLFSDHSGGRFSSLRYGGIFGKKDPGAGRRYVPELETGFSSNVTL